jgi:hypothetical protein
VIEVQHAGDWDPTQYRNYTEPDRTYKRPKRRYEGLPALSPVSRPCPLDEKLEQANVNDLKTKNLK